MKLELLIPIFLACLILVSCCGIATIPLPDEQVTECPPPPELSSGLVADLIENHLTLVDLYHEECAKKQAIIASYNASK